MGKKSEMAARGMGSFWDSIDGTQPPPQLNDFRYCTVCGATIERLMWRRHFEWHATPDRRAGR